MRIFIPCILMELLHEEGWHMNYDPTLCGQYLTHDKAKEELERGINLILDSLKDDSRFILCEQVEPDSDKPAVQMDVYYTDRCITLKGYIYSGPIRDE